MRVLSSTLLTLAAAGPALAAETDAPPADDGSTVVVTADRQPTTVESTTASVSVVDAVDREREGYPARWTEQVGREPGVDTPHRSGGFSGGGLVEFRLRGTQSNSDTRVLLDGIPWNEPASIAGDPSLGVLQPGGVDRIEVVRGPQSGLYGSRAVGGVVNFVSARPTVDQEGTGRIEAGSFRTRSAEASATGPIIRGEGERPLLGYAVGGAALASDGISVKTRRPDGNPEGFERDGLHRENANARIEANPLDAVTVYGAGWLAQAKHRYDGNAGPDDDHANRIDRHWRAASGAEVRMPAEAVLAVDAAYTDSTRDQRDDFPGRFDSNDTWISSRLGMPVMDWLRGQVGVDWERQAADYSGADISERIVGVWAQTLATWRQCEASLVGRHDDYGRGEDADTWRAGAAWLPFSRRLKLHAAAGTAYRAPSIDERFGNYPAFFFRGNPDLEPQRSFGWEAGASGEPIEGLTVGSTYFSIAYDNRIVITPTFDTLTNESSTSKVYGVENAAEWDPVGQPLSARASYTWQQSRDEQGQPFVGTPRSKGMVSTTYDVRWGWATVAVDGVSGRRDRDGTSFGGYATLDAVIGWRPRASIDVYLRGENLLDKQHTDAAAAPGTWYTGMPRAVFLGVVGRY